MLVKLAGLSSGVESFQDGEFYVLYMDKSPDELIFLLVSGFCI